MLLRDFLIEASLPNTNYGYWIDPFGEVFPVGFQQHQTVLDRYAKMDINFAIKKGWVKVTALKELYIILSIDRMRPAVLSQITKMTRSQDFRGFIIENIDDNSYKGFDLAHEFVRYLNEQYHRD